MRFGPINLLEYDARFRVLICRKCQYAIQKSAVNSHLLRHKIYREERQQLQDTIAQLDLLEPEEVPLPKPWSPSIDGLPVIPGYRCTAPACEKLYASAKRMKQHWAEAHDVSGAADVSLLACPVKLQTFFRGTKIKYFEVQVSANVTAAPASIPIEEEKEEEEDHDDEEECDQQMQDASVIIPSPISSQSTTHKRPPTANLDLETLGYFHHFFTTTNHTLPRCEDAPSPKHYWQKNVVHIALQFEWLMRGLLALSALHLASIPDGTTMKKATYEHSVQLSFAFFADWEVISKWDTTDTMIKEHEKMAGHQVNWLLRCAHWSTAGFTHNQEPIPELKSPSSLQAFMTIIGEMVATESGFCLRDIRNIRVADREQTFNRAATILKSKTASDRDFAHFDRLEKLPTRMTEIFGRPDNIQDVLATLWAIATLVECCEVSFASEDMGAAWHGMAAWLIKVPDHFNHLVACNSPAALVVVANWAFLVKRAEQHCWFLKGATQMITGWVTERISVVEAKGAAMQGLIQDEGLAYGF